MPDRRKPPIRELREYLALSNRQMADKLCLRVTTYRNMDCGEKPVSAATAMRAEELWPEILDELRLSAMDLHRGYRFREARAAPRASA